MLLFTAAALAQSQKNSTITIHVGKSGMFSGFGHEHTVIAHIAKAAVDPKAMTVEITVAAREMKVADKELSDKDRAQVQTDMLGPKVMDAQKFPEVRFKSTRVEQTSPQHYRVSGDLSLHGVTKQIVLEATDEAGRYRGTTKFKQSDFGIKPISVGGGAVKVKDELSLEFEVFAQH